MLMDERPNERRKTAISGHAEADFTINQTPISHKWINEPKHDKKTCVPSEDSDEPGHPTSLNQSIHCPHVEALGSWLFIELTMTTLNRLGGCHSEQTGWMPRLI